MKEKVMELKIGPTATRLLSVATLVLFSFIVACAGGGTKSDFIQAWCVIAMILSWVGAVGLFVVTLVYHFDQ